MSFAICDVVTRELSRAVNRKYTGTQPGMRSTPKKQQPEEKYHDMVVNEEAVGGNTQVRGAAGDGAEEDGENRQELTHKEPGDKNN